MSRFTPLRESLSRFTSWLASLPRTSRVALAATLVGLLAAGGANIWRVAHTSQPPPTTLSVNLERAQKEVPLDQALIVRSSRAVALPAFAHAFRLVPAARGKITASHDHRTFTWRPSEPLAELTAYTIRIAGLRDASGLKVVNAVWAFTTTLVPRVQSLVLQGGQPLGEGAEIPAGAALQLNFNTAINPASVAILANGASIPVSWADDHRSANIGAAELHPGGLQLALAPGGLDAVGRPLADWKLNASIYYHADIHTTPLQTPALIQIPNDSYGARPQSGVQAASLVFESLAEGNITRLTALFTSIPDQVGPIRSGRLISFKLTRHYRGMLFASGLSDGSNAVLNSDPVPHTFDTGGWYFRTGYPRVVPNNLFISADRVRVAQGQLAAFPLPAGPVSPINGGAASHVDVAVHHSSYDYDAATATYLKTEDGQRMTDAALGQPLHIQMLVVLHTSVTVTGIIEDVNGVRGLDYDIDGSGAADFYYQGQSATGTWSSADRSSPLSFKLANGAPLNLPSHGLVWIDVVP